MSKQFKMQLQLILIPLISVQFKSAFMYLYILTEENVLINYFISDMTILNEYIFCLITESLK